MTRIQNIDNLWYKALTCTVSKVSADSYEVASPTGGIYDVKLDGKYTRECNCMSGQHNPISGCSHIMAAAVARAREKGYEPIWPVPQDHDWTAEKADGVFRLGQGVVLMVKKKDAGEDGERKSVTQADWFDSF